MKRLAFLLALGALGCASNGDPPAGPGKSAQTAAATPVEARDVAILVLEQTPAALRVVSSSRRPRSSFGPSASWNGAGTPTHRWSLLGPHGETLASGDIVSRGAVEAPPSPQDGVPAANVPLSSFSFDVKVPQPAPGETIEITSAGAARLAVRWP